MEELKKNKIQDKKKQLQIILELNPMLENEYIDINDIDDILTYEEAFEKGDDCYCVGDFYKNNAKEVLRTRRVEIFANNDIENGKPVFTSKNKAIEEAGGKRDHIVSKVVDIEAVAWKDAVCGIYANVKSATRNKTWKRI